MAKKKVADKQLVKRKRGSLKPLELDKAALTAAALGTFMLASEVQAAEEDKAASQARQDEDLLQQAQAEQSAEADQPAALSADDLPELPEELADADLPLEELPQAAAEDIPAADLDGTMLSQAAPDVTVAPGVDGKTVMSDAGSGGSAGSAGSASAAAADAGAAGTAAGGAAAGGLPGLAAFSAIPAGVIAGVVGAVGVVAAASGGSSSGSAFAGGSSSSSKGLVVDGNVAGAKIFYDADADGVLDPDEKWTTTDANGHYELSGYTETSVGQFVVLAGGVDVLTGQTVGMMITPHGYTNVSPLTTLMAASGLSEAELKNKLGIDPSIDLNNYDPIADMKSDDPVKAANAQKAFTVSQQVYAVLQTAAELKGKLDDGSVDAADITAIAKKLGDSIMSSTGSDSLSILQQASQETVLEAANGNTELANSVSAALSTVASSIQSSYEHLADALKTGTASDVANAVSVAAVSQSALVDAVGKAAAPGGDSSTLSLLSDADSLTKLANEYKSGIANNIQSGGTTKVEVSLPTTYTIDQAQNAATLPAKYTIVDSPDHIKAYLTAHTGGSPLLSGALGVVVQSADPINLLEAKYLIENFPSVSFQQKNIAPGSGTEDLPLDKAKELADKFLKFPAGDQISVLITQADIGTVTDYALKFGNLGIDEIDPGASLKVTAAQATALVVTGHMVFAAGADVTLNLQQSEVGTALATSAGAKALHDAGIDHLAATSGSLSLTLEQAQNLLGAHLDLAAGQHGTLLTSTTSGISDDLLHSLALAHIDTIAGPTTAPSVATSDHFAHQMVAEGLHFADASDVDLELVANHSGHTHLSTSLKDLQKLGVDHVGIAAGTGNVLVDVGDGDWGTSNLPSFDTDDSVHLQFKDAQLQDVIDHKAALVASHVDDLTVDDLDVTLTVTQADALLGNDGKFDVGADLGFHTANDVTLTVMNNAMPLNHIVQEAAALKELGVDQINVGGASVVNVDISDLQAEKLVDAGLHFTSDDHINVEVSGVAGTHVHTSLQELQKLGVDSISVAGGGHGDFTIDIGDSSQLNFGGLPHFNTADHVTLSVSGSADGEALFDHLDALHDAGIDTIFVKDSNVELSLPEAEAVFHSGLQFDSLNDVTLEVAAQGEMTSDEVLADLIGSVTDLQHLGVDHLAAAAPAHINESAAHALVHAGIDFATDSNVTMNVDAVHGEGTHLTSTLKDLQKLHVDTITASGAAALTLDLGPGAFDAGTSLPQFAAGLNVTLNVGVNQIGQVAQNYTNIHDHGVDFIQVHGTAAELSGVLPMQVNNAHIHGFTLDVVPGNDLSPVDGLVGLAASIPTLPHVGAAHVDKIDVAGMAGHASELHVDAALASKMIAAGISFEAADHVSLDVTAGASGTHFATSADALHKLGVDHVDVHVNDTGAFDLHSLNDFDDALDVTLDLSEVSQAHLPTLDAAAGVLLESLGIDSIGMNVDVSSLSDKLLGNPHVNNDGALDIVHGIMGLDLAVDLQGSTDLNAPSDLDAAMQQLYHDWSDGGLLTDNYEHLINALAHSGVADLTVERGSVEVSDSLLSALAESGMLHAVGDSNIVVDASASGQHMFTSLKDLADLDVDKVDMGGTTGNLYINLGELGQTGALNEVKALLSHLDPHMFEGAATPTLVLDVRTATALLDNTTGHFDATIMGGLEAVGIKEVAVLVGHNETTDIVAQSAALHTPEVKLIGQDADPTLYDDLHHPR